jgi:hypothetical protein
VVCSLLGPGIIQERDTLHKQRNNIPPYHLLLIVSWVSWNLKTMSPSSLTLIGRSIFDQTEEDEKRRETRTRTRTCGVGEGHG